MSVSCDKINVVPESFNNIDVCKRITQINPEMDEAFFVCDLGEVMKRYFAMKRLMPRVTPYYAMKCNPNPFIVRALAAIGCNFECASENEIRQVLDMNISPNKILFGHPIKPVSHLEYVLRERVYRMTFDSEDELYKIKKHYPNAELVLRLRCDAKDCDFTLGNKFGCDPVTEGPVLLKLAKEINLKVIGISFHVGSGCKESEVYDRAIKFARDLFDFGKQIGYSFYFLDIGGGFYGFTHCDIMPAVNIINTALNKYFSTNQYPNLMTISEFGQYYVAACSTLVCNVLGRKTRVRSSDNGKCGNGEICYYINDAVYKNFICAICGDIYYPLPKPLYEDKKSKLIPSTIWGCTVEEEDKLYDKILLPEMQTGDFLIIEQMGAYAQSIETTYSGFPKTQFFPFVNEYYYSILKKTAFYNSNDFNYIEFQYKNV